MSFNNNGVYLNSTLTIFRKSSRHLSPAHGAALTNSNYLQNLYNFGDDDNKAVQLVRALFHQNVYGEPLLPTRNKSKPAYYLNPTRIAQWISVFEKDHLTEEERLNEKENLYRPWQRESKCSRKSLNVFIELLPLANAESYRYFSNIGTTILLSWLWMKSKTKHSLLEYILKLTEKLDVLSSSKKKIIHEKYQESWLNKKFQMLGPDTKKESRSLDRSEDLEFMIANAIVAKNRYLPPRIPNAYYGYRNEEEKPDCAERCIVNCVRGLINRVIFNASEQKFDVEKLKEMGATKDLLTFYKKYSKSLTSVSSRKSGQHWFDLLSNRPNIDYLTLKEGFSYEVSPSKSNFLRLFRSLFLRNIESWKDVEDTISTSNVKVTITDSDSNVHSNDGSIEFRFIYKSNYVHTTTLDIRHRTHAFLKELTPFSTFKDVLDFRNTWKRYQKGTSIQLAPILSVYIGVVPSLIDDVTPTCKDEKECRRHCLLSVNWEARNLNLVLRHGEKLGVPKREIRNYSERHSAPY